MSALTDFFKNVGAGRLAIIFGVTVAVAAALLFMMARTGEGQRALLYGGLQAADAARITQALDQGGVPYEIAEGGGSIYVKRDAVSQARILVAGQGALSSGTVGYEIFDRSDALGSTQFVQNVNARRATEGELARTIASIQGISAARVHLVLPERRLFERDTAEPTATVVVGLTDSSLAANHARTIRNLVATAVPGLQPSRVTVVDETGRTLANGAGDDEEMGMAMLEDRRATLEERLRRKVLDALLPVVGASGARVQVAAELDLTRISRSNETYDPDGQVVRSSETIEESTTERDAGGAAVTVAGNLPDNQVGEDQADGPTLESNRAEQTLNYEISRVTTTEVREAGEITRLSVAVAVDEARVVAEDGTVTFRPRTPEELAQIAAIARAAVGFNPGRGDVLEVTSLPFERPDLTLGAEDPGPFAFDKNDILRFAEIGVLLVIGLALTLLVAAPLVRGVVSPMPALAVAGAPAALPASPRPAQIAGPPEQEALPPPEEEEGTINIEAIDGKLKASTIKRVSEVVEAHPEESMTILRSWMHER